MLYVAHNRNPLEMIFTKPHVMGRNKAAKQKTRRCFSFYKRVRIVLSEMSSSWNWVLFCPAIFQFSLIARCSQTTFYFWSSADWVHFFHYKKSWANKRTNEKNPLQLWYIRNSTQINICIRCCVWFSLCCYRVIVSGVNAPKGNISYLHLVLGFATLRC